MPAERNILLGGYSDALCVETTLDPERGSIELPVMDRLGRGSVAERAAAKQPEAFIKNLIINGLFDPVKSMEDPKEVDLTAQQWAYRTQSICDSGARHAQALLPHIQTGLQNAASRSVARNLRSAAARGAYELEVSRVETIADLGVLAVGHRDPQLFMDSVGILDQALFGNGFSLNLEENHPVLLRNALGAVRELRPPNGRPNMPLDKLWSVDEVAPEERSERVIELGARITRHLNGAPRFSRTLPSLSYYDANKVILNYATGEASTDSSDARDAKLQQIRQIVLHTALM